MQRLAVLDRRRAGVLLHPTSLLDPGQPGTGALGAAAREFVDWVADAGFTVWQMLPLGPTGPDGSPYWVRSDYAGNPALIDPAELPARDDAAFAAFVESERHWLADYARFEAASTRFGGAPWWTWPAALRDREPGALQQLDAELGAAIDHVKRQQFWFAVQWRRLREHAHSRGVRLFGDVPFYVAPDSAETWAQRSQFRLGPDGRATHVAGVPPDYFSELGQFWGNPLYDWRAMEADDFAFWRARVRHQLARFDVLRIDHFRALAAHWAIPAGAPDARTGSWEPTPGVALFERLRRDLGDLPIVAEDLGIITPDVERLRRDNGLPGMRVLQFAFGGDADNPHLPYMHERDGVVYTGTHDNDTTMGWYESLDPAERARVDEFLGAAPGTMPWPLIRAALGSVGLLAVVPVQDLLALGARARFNTPGTAEGNWSWKLPRGALTPELVQACRRLVRLYGRGA